MLDIQFRPLKDQIFNPLSRLIPRSVTPGTLTLFAFICGIESCYFALSNNTATSLTFWVLNRALDCLDGAVARHRNQSSDLGGFFDLLGDFIVYSLIPICCGLSSAAEGGGSGKLVRLWVSIALVEASFHINNFVLFFVAAVVEKRRAGVVVSEQKKKSSAAAGRNESEEKIKELTSVAMRPALIEGVESGLLFTVMLAVPAWTEWVCWLMAGLVAIGVFQRVFWLAGVMG